MANSCHFLVCRGRTVHGTRWSVNRQGLTLVQNWAILHAMPQDGHTPSSETLFCPHSSASVCAKASKSARGLPLQSVHTCSEFFILFLWLFFFILISIVFLVSIVVFVIFVLFLRFLFFFRSLNLLNWRIRVNTQFLGHESVHSADKSRWVSNFIARFNECSLEQHLSGVKRCGILFVTSNVLRPDIIPIWSLFWNACAFMPM